MRVSGQPGGKPGACIQARNPYYPPHHRTTAPPHHAEYNDLLLWARRYGLIDDKTLQLCFKPGKFGHAKQFTIRVRTSRLFGEGRCSRRWSGGAGQAQACPTHVLPQSRSAQPCHAQHTYACMRALQTWRRPWMTRHVHLVASWPVAFSAGCAGRKWPLYARCRRGSSCPGQGAHQFLLTARARSASARPLPALLMA